MDFQENAGLRMGTANKVLSARERRILLTQWVGKSWEKIHDENSSYQNCLWRYFEKTGCLLTADGSDDCKVNPEGLENYVVPPPANFIAPPENAVPCETPEPANPEPDIQDVEPTEPPEDDPQEDRVDSEENRNFEHENVGKKLKRFTIMGGTLAR